MNNMASAEKFKDQYIKVPTNEKETISEKAKVPTVSKFGVRHVQLVIFFICVTISFVARGHLGVTIVAMTSQNITENDTVYVTGVNASEFTDSDIKSNSNDTGSELDDAVEWTVYRRYNWSKPVQDMVLSSFFVGYCIMMFPIALVCQRWGGKLPLQISLLVNGIVTLLMPSITLWGGWKAVSACRILQGLSQAGTFPGIQTLLSKWAPLSERATLSGYVYTGTTLGNVIGFQLGGVLSEVGGWPVTFWVVGVLCLLCFVLLTVLASASPSDHKTISEDERNFITGQINTGVVQKRRKAPWKAIFTSGPMWASFSTHVGSGVAFIFFFTQMPSYIHYILKIDVKSSGLLSSLPYVASLLTSFGFGVISDYLTNKKIISTKVARITFNTISQVGVPVCLVGASYASTTTLVVICFVVAMGCHMGIHTGWMVNHMDMAPNFSGTMMAIGNTLMNIFVIILPVLVSNIVVDVTNLYQWRIIIYMVAAIAFFSNIVFVVFMSAEEQPWNKEVEDADSECLEDQKKALEVQKSNT